MGSIMGSQKIMGSDYGSNISEGIQDLIYFEHVGILETAIKKYSHKVISLTSKLFVTSFTVDK